MQEKNSQNANDVINRLKLLLRLKTDIQLAEFLNIRPNTISTWKKRNTLDYETIISICDLYELDLNEVFLNKRNMSDSGAATPLIAKEAQFQYASGHDRQGLMDAVPKYSFPFVSAEKTLAFQVVSNNMFPLIDENSFVICESSSLETVSENKVAVIVSCNKGIFLNRVTRNPYKLGQLLLASENDFYNEVILSESDVSEVWVVRGVLSYDLNHEGKFSFINDSLRKINTFIKKNEITDK